MKKNYNIKSWTILNKTLIKVNAKRQNCFGCHVLSDCDRRTWIAVDNNVWKITTSVVHYAKMINQRRNWNEHWHIPGWKLLGINLSWLQIYKIEWIFQKAGKWMGKPIYISKQINNNYIVTLEHKGSRCFRVEGRASRVIMSCQSDWSGEEMISPSDPITNQYLYMHDTSDLISTHVTVTLICLFQISFHQ